MATTKTGGVTALPGQVFQEYLDNYFNFPQDIKNDIIYCQRALKAHIKVHQAVLDKFKPLESSFPVERKRVIDELESEIYEINAEQHFLFLRLRRNIDNFNKLLKKNGLPVDATAINGIVAKEVMPHVMDESMPVAPTTVVPRLPEPKLLEKYCAYIATLEQSNRQVYEIVDSDDEGRLVIVEGPEKPNTRSRSCSRTDASSKPNNEHEKHQSNGTATVAAKSSAALATSTTNLTQMSLLKPMAQRVTSGPVHGIARRRGSCLPDGLKPNILQQSSHKSTKADTASAGAGTAVSNTDQHVPKNVRQSRMNLRQALTKAQTMVANAAGKLMPPLMAAPVPSLAPLTLPSQPRVPSSTAVAVKAASTALPPPAAKREVTARRGEGAGHGGKARATRAAAAAAAVVAAAPTKGELQSSSEESSVEREPTPPAALWPPEHEETRTMPEEYGQEMFLRLFMLYTPEMIMQMQQRRSKRKRRNVHSNERADFHYERVEYGSYPPPEEHKKKRKEFLLSPVVKRGLQSKRPKRGSSDKNSEDVSPPSRSSSSSPDEKRGCNECLKSGGDCLNQCDECKGYYHQMCHREEDDTQSCSTKKQETEGTRKLCPACKRAETKERMKLEAEQYKALHSEAKVLEQQIAKEKTRRASLQHESNLYKIEMHTLLNLVKSIKSDGEEENDAAP